MQRLIEVGDLLIVHENEKTVTFEGGDSFGKLLFPIQRRTLTSSIEDSLRFLRLNQTSEYGYFRLIESLHFLLHTDADQLAKRQSSRIELKCTSSVALTSGGFIKDRESQ